MTQLQKAIAFYLPQYHPIEENSRWWGEGFTEWTNVGKAKPNFKGHYQPHVPRDLGYYDLRLPQTMLSQIELAKTYGIYGFCFYWYWFNGRRVLEFPVEQFANLNSDFPYCICWANENWTRTWDGHNKDVLLAQQHSESDDIAFIKAAISHFKNERYITVDGNPVLLVYRVDLFPDMRSTAARWRECAKVAGFADLHLCAVQFYGIDDPREWGFDAAVEFPPHKFFGHENRYDGHIESLNPHFTFNVVDYCKVVAQALTKEDPDYEIYRGVMPSWDNTARRQNNPHTIVNPSPELYQHWLATLVNRNSKRSCKSEFIFINAWNEWAEGCHLEPDLKFGHSFLEATYKGLQGLHPFQSKKHMTNGDYSKDNPFATTQALKDCVRIAQENRIICQEFLSNRPVWLAMIRKIMRKTVVKQTLKKLYAKFKLMIQESL